MNRITVYIFDKYENSIEIIYLKIFCPKLANYNEK